jgi:hypothetical protein
MKSRFVLANPQRPTLPATIVSLSFGFNESIIAPPHSLA